MKHYTSYDYPYQHEWSYERIEVDRRLNFVLSDIPTDHMDRVGILLEGEGALEKAAQIAQEAPGAKIFLADPNNVIDSNWINEACRNAADYEVLREIENLPELVDELHLLAADSLKHPTDPDFKRIIELSRKQHKICGHTPTGDLGQLNGRWPLPRTLRPGEERGTLRYHKVDDIDLCIVRLPEKKPLMFGTSAEGKRRIDEWIKWADKKAYDEMTEAKTENWEAMVKRYESTGRKVPRYGVARETFASFFGCLADNMILMKVMHHSGEILEITSSNKPVEDFESLFEIDANEFRLLDYWMESAVSNATCIEDCEFSSRGRHKSVASRKTGASFELYEFAW